MREFGIAFTRQMQEKTLFGNGVAIFQPGVAHGPGGNTGEGHQRIGKKKRIAAGFAQPHQHMFIFAVRLERERFSYLESCSPCFYQTGRGRFALQPVQLMIIQIVSHEVLTSSATASQAMPSPLPVKPNCSVVVALTLTSFM